MQKKFPIVLSVFTAMILVLPMVLGAQARPQVRQDNRAPVPEQMRERVHATTVQQRGQMMENQVRGDVEINEAVRQSVRKRIEAHRKEMREEIQARRASFQERSQQRREELRTQRGQMQRELPEQAKQRVSDRVDHIAEVFQNVLSNFGRVADNLQNRIEVAEDRGYDMSSTTMLLAEARAQLDVASEDIEQSISSTTDEVVSDGAVSANSIRSFIETARESMLEAREVLNEALQAYGREISSNAQQNDGDDEEDNDVSTTTEDDTTGTTTEE